MMIIISVFVESKSDASLLMIFTIISAIAKNSLANLCFTKNFQSFVSISLNFPNFLLSRQNFSILSIKLMKSQIKVCICLVSNYQEEASQLLTKQKQSPRNVGIQPIQQQIQQPSQLQNKYSNIHKKFFPNNSREHPTKLKCCACGNPNNNENEMETIYSFKICQHQHCLGCIRKLINQQYINKVGCVECSFCQKQLSQQEIEKYVGPERISYLKQKLKTGVSPQLQKIQCSFCFRYLNNKDLKIGQRPVCKTEECQKKNFQACQKIAVCKHFCNGFKEEKQCLGCLGCTNQILSEEFCSICFTESLYEGPCIKSTCGHIFHYNCILQRLAKKWSTMYISFGFCACSICKRWMEFPKDSCCQKLLHQYHDLQQQLRKQASLRMGKMGDNHILKVEDAMDIFAFYQCFNCNKPYFGGKKDCQLELEQENDRQNQSELVCPSCCGQQINGCKNHGTEYLEYKCKYCCNIATYYCWGTTHFCQNCHTKQSGGKYLTQLKMENLPHCQGKGKCPIGGSHAPNGQEYCLGCGIFYLNHFQLYAMNEL